MSEKSRALLYILIGTILFIIGLALIYGDIITFGAVITALSGSFLVPGFMMLFG